MTRRKYWTSTRRLAALSTSLLTIAWMFVAALPASAQVITVILDPAEATNAVGTDHTVTATVMEDAAALEGAVVLFGVSAEGTATPDTGSVTTDAAGEAEFTFTNSAEVTNTITACVDEDESDVCEEGEATDSALKTWVVPVATTIELVPAEETNPVDSTHTLTATVKDQLEPPQPFAGAAVHFDVSGDPTPDPDSGDAVTDAAGDADFAFTNDTEGTNTITACIDENENEACDEGEPFDTATKIWEEPVPTTIELTPEMGLNQPGEDHTVVAKVTDQFDAPVAGVSVEIDVDEDGSPNPTALTQNTDANGEVEFTFTNSEVSANTITACIAGTETCDTAEKLWQDPVPTTIELAPATGTNPTDTSHTVTATVLDQFEEPFEAVDVHFDVTGDGTPTPAAGDDATDVAGEAEFAFTNDTAGTNTITACIDLDESGTCGMEPSDTATKVWVEVTDTITLAPLTETNEPGTAHVVTATVLNASAAPVEGAAVHVSVSGGGTPTPAAGDLTTDAAGEADFVFTNATAGTNTITACLDVDDSGTCDEGEPTATATKVWQGVPPECPGFEGDPRNDVIGTAASDTLIGTGAADIICGKGSADEINGKGGRDLLLGGGGNDDIFGKKGNDRLKGGKGKDLLNGGKGTDVCKGGPGKDTIKKCEN
jgi:uncharacterized GH25 family protein